MTVTEGRPLATVYSDSRAGRGMRRGGRLTGGGTTGNERLTTAIGATLIVLLAVIGVTILRIGQLLWVHMFVGMLLVGPVLLKMSSTGYRFFRYYTANPCYRRKGPPTLALRLLAVLRADYSPSERLSSDVTGRTGRVLALSGALVAGAVLAVLVIPDFGPWLNGIGHFHHFHR